MKLYIAAFSLTFGHIELTAKTYTTIKALFMLVTYGWLYRAKRSARGPYQRFGP